jgi:hypothetical protein
MGGVLATTQASTGHTPVFQASTTPGTKPGNASDFRRMPTPSRLWLALLAAVVALLAVGATCATTLAGRQASETRAVNSAEHLTVNADELYHTLADADATAATALLVSPVPPARLTDQYNSDIAQSENALSQASRDLAGDDTASSQLAQVATQLPIYTGLVATAQADNRLGYPVGAAYLREASTLLRERILPEVKAVADRESAAHESAQAGAGGFPLWVVLVALLAVSVIVVTGRTVSRATRRSVNPGLAVGALIALILVIYSLAATNSATDSSNRAQSDFTNLSMKLQARDNLALAESFQSLALIDRGEDNGTDTTQENQALGAVQQDTPQTGKALDDQATKLLGVVKAQAAAIQKDVSAGNYYQAIDLAVGHGDQQGTNTMSAKAAALDTALVDAFNRDQNTYVADSGATGSTLGGGLWLGIVGGAIAAAAAAYGINRRLAEYR